VIQRSSSGRWWAKGLAGLGGSEGNALLTYLNADNSEVAVAASTYRARGLPIRCVKLVKRLMFWYNNINELSNPI